MLTNYYILITALLLMSNCIMECTGGKILALIPTIGASHWMAAEPLMKELAARGHQVTVLGTFPSEKSSPNYTYIDVSFDLQTAFKNLGLDENRNTLSMGDMPTFFMINFLVNLGSIIAESVLSTENTHKLIYDKEKEFDVIIYEPFFSEAVLGFVHKFQTPSILFSMFVGDEFVTDAVGNPYPYSYVPSAFLTYTDHMSFCERLRNVIAEVFIKSMFWFIHFPKQDAIMRKYFGHLKDLPHISELYQQTSLVFLNSHESITYPRPFLPNVIPVGGLHIKKPKKLPEDLQKFMDDASDGVILFSMGSRLRSADLSIEKRNALLNAFSKLKQKVLWKFEVDNLPNQPRNVEIKKWIPQNDILAHPNMRVFITHGGLLSTQEATYYGVPVIGIPILGDQKLNMARTELSGCGLTLGLDNITESSVTWALNELINNPRYKESARYRSQLFKDRPDTPLETAVYWTEYVMRHKGAPHLRSAALDLTWYQYYLLDVIATLVLSIAAVMYIMFLMLTKFFHIFSKKKVLDKKKKN